jgi:hypothetical protein
MLGIGSSDQELQQLSETLQALPPQHPLASVIATSKDFLHPDALADALLHPQDRAYTVPQVQAWLDRCGVHFGRWVDQAPYLPQCGALAATPHAALLGRLSASAQHAAVELWRGAITKHHFTAHLHEGCADPPWDPFDSRPSSRRRHRWHHLIPLRVPWTVTVRERLPAGVVAVLINRAHTFADLILAVDKDQHTLLSAIDGQRNLAEIVGNCATGISEKRALSFFKKLWQYDQVVFDGSLA